MDVSALTKLMQEQGKTAGYSQRDIAKAIKKLRTGKVDMSQVTPHLTQAMMNGNTIASESLSREEKRANLRRIIRQKEMERNGKIAQKMHHQRQSDRIKKRREGRKLEKELEKIEREEAVLDQKEEIAKLGQKIGKVTEALYNHCLIQVREDNFKTDKQRKQANNIVELYHQQNKFDDKIEQATLDDLLDADDELSDLSDEEDVSLHQGEGAGVDDVIKEPSS